MRLQQQRLASQRDPTMSMTHADDILNPELCDSLEALQALVLKAAGDGTPLHEFERAVWQQVLRIGHHALTSLFALLGDGDKGETVTLPDGPTLQRLDDPHDRRYVSVFGEFVLSRVCYGSREGQKIEFVPLDNR